MIKDKILYGFTAFLFVLGLGCISYVLIKGYTVKKTIEEVGVTNCIDKSLVKVMKDKHLAGVIDKGEKYRVLKNFFNCNPVNRNDLVWFRIAEPIEPVVRIVRGLPGDTFKVIENESEKNQWYIQINNEFVMDGSNKYFFSSQITPPLKTYEISRKGKLDKDEYILLSSTPPGLSDSGNLGLIKRTALEGKVLTLQ